MAIKSGTFIHDIHGFVIDRIQTGGVSNVNIPQTKIYELGNYNAVGTVFDVPDLSFDLESLDVSCEIEALIHGVAPTNTLDAHEFNFNTTFPLDVISPFKAGNGSFAIVKGIAVPYLTLDTVTYNFGVGQNSTEQFTLRGDGIYYIPGSPYYEEKTLVNNTLTYNLGHAAVPYTESGNTFHVLGACVKNVSTGIYKRLFYSTTDTNGYTDTTTTITTNHDWFDDGYTKLHVVYGSTTAATYSAAVHEDSTVKPAAIRSKDVLLYIGTAGATSTLSRWSGVQSFSVNRRVNLQNDEEFGNAKYVATDYDVPEVAGTITVRSSDIAGLFTIIEQITGTTANEVSGPINTPLMEVLLQVRHPTTGTILKSWNIPDARFTIPGPQGRVQTKLDVQIPFTSDAGLLSVFRGNTS